MKIIKSAPSVDFVHEEQIRLAVGPFVLVVADDTSWALPGGERATYGDLSTWARQQGWRRPEMGLVIVRRRIDVPKPVCLGVDTDMAETK